MMKAALSCVLILSLALGAQGCAHTIGQDIEWKTLNDEVLKLYGEGQYDRAVVIAKKALSVAEQNRGPDHPDVATSLNSLALLYQAQGRYAEAEPLHERSLAITEKALGPNHPAVADVLENLSNLYESMGQEDKAREYADRAAKIRAMRR